MSTSSLECFAALRQSAADLNHHLDTLDIELSHLANRCQHASHHPPDTWPLLLSAAERAALIDLQFTGSALAMGYRHQCPRPLLALYEQWADALDTSSPRFGSP